MRLFTVGMQRNPHSEGGKCPSLFDAWPQDWRRRSTMALDRQVSNGSRQKRSVAATPENRRLVGAAKPKGLPSPKAQTPILIAVLVRPARGNALWAVALPTGLDWMTMTALAGTVAWREIQPGIWLKTLARGRGGAQY